MLGQVLLGKYRVSRLLDQGGMCKIWLARQFDTPREAVVKVLQERLAGQAKPREFLRREIHILSRFPHPHAVGFYDAAANDPSGPVLVMEYLRGVDLGTLLQREGRLLPERAGRLLAQLCDVLAAAHEVGIVHHDIKPGNLMILYPGTPRETLKLMDFGLAKMASLLYIGADDLIDFTLPAAAGTPEYIAPEQALGQDIDARGDLYSTGVVLYEMLSGRRPFEHGRPEDLLHAHARAEPPSFAERGIAHIPPAVEEVVRACLAKHPEERPRDAVELLQRYEDALGKRLARAASGVRARSVSEDPSLAYATGSDASVVDCHALRRDFDADMPEAMAMLKLKGFLHDLGSDVMESAPGMIRVRLAAAQPPKKPNGLLALLDRGLRSPSRSGRGPADGPSTAAEVELRLARPDPSQSTRLQITLIMRPGNGVATAEWRTHCQKISQDLKAYLMSR